MRKYLEPVVKLLIVLTFFVPLVLIPSKFIFPFIVPKILLFRTLVLLMLGTYLLLLVGNWQKYKVKFTGLNLAVGLFFASFALSTFIGVDWYKSFWDNHERMLGLFTIFHYLIYYLVISSVIKEWRDWRWLLRIFLLAGALVMFLGLLQKANPELLLNRGSGRVSATLGNAIYYSGYGLFLFYLGMLLWWKEENRSWKYFALIGGGLGFLGIFWGGTRGTVLGLIASIGILLFGYLISLQEHKKARQIIAAVVIASLAILGILFIFRQTPMVRNIPAVGRLLNTSISSDTASTRLMAWEIAVKAWQEKPVFGWGPNNYYYAFNKYYNPKSLEYGWGETWFDNAHSAIFNTLAVQGIAGLIFYLGLFGTPIYCLWRGYKKGQVDVHLASIGTAFLTGHFIHNAVVFENPTSYLYFFFFLAFINSQSGYPDPPAITKENKISISLVSIVSLVILLLIYSTNLNPARANMASLETLAALQTASRPAEAYKAAVLIPSPHIDDIRADFVRGVSNVLPQYASQPALSEKGGELLQLAYNDLKKNLQLHPLDIRNQILLAQIIQQGVYNLKQPPEMLLEAEALLQNALEISPRRQQLQYSLALLALQMKKPEQAIALLNQSLVSDSNIGEGWWRLALTYQEIGEIEKARRILKRAEEKGIKFDDRGKEIAQWIMSASALTTGTGQ